MKFELCDKVLIKKLNVIGTVIDVDEESDNLIVEDCRYYHENELIPYPLYDCKSSDLEMIRKANK